jgi:peptidase M28-like protein
MRSSHLMLTALVVAMGCSRGVVVQPGSPTAPAPYAGGSATSPARVRSLLSALADDSMEGRGTGTRGSARAARFIAGEMQRIGLTPVGDSGFFQRVPMTRPDPNGPRLTLLPSLSDLDTMPAARRVLGVNVVGVLRGSDPALRDEGVLIDAHYDHIGIGSPINGDSINNGADDDASGVVTVLEIARALAAGPPPKRTIIFATTTGEEIGLAGTQWYIAHPPFPLARTVANLEIEMIGRPDSLAGGPGKGWLTGYERSTMGDALAKHGVPIVRDPRPADNYFERSDNIAFARIGIPAHTLSSYNGHLEYHTPLDDLAHIDVDHMARVVDAAIRAARLLADGPKPEWHRGGRPLPR